MLAGRIAGPVPGIRVGPVAHMPVLGAFADGALFEKRTQSPALQCSVPDTRGRHGDFCALGIALHREVFRIKMDKSPCITISNYGSFASSPQGPKQGRHSWFGGQVTRHCL